MKVIEILEIENIILNSEARNNNQEDENFGKLLNLTEEQLKPFKYCFLRNKLKIKNVVEEKNEILKLIEAEFSELENKEDLNYNEYVLNHEKFQEFLQEERDVELYTIKVEVFKNTDFNEKLVYSLVGKLIKE